MDIRGRTVWWKEWQEPVQSIFLLSVNVQCLMDDVQCSFAPSCKRAFYSIP